MFIDCIRSTLQMLTNIENRLEELFEQIEVMPPDRVEMAEKVRWEKFITKSSKQQQAAFKSKNHSLKRYEILHGSNFAPHPVLVPMNA